MFEQWQAELDERFGLLFVILDRTYFAQVRRERGFNVNPWRTHSRFLVGHRLLIDETYAGPLAQWLDEDRSGNLLILDEAHHAAPSSGGRCGIDSQFTCGTPVRPRALDEVMVRRLKEDIHQTHGGFPERHILRIPLDHLPDDAPELQLSRLLDRYRTLREAAYAHAPKRQQAAAGLVCVGLQQRRLSSIDAFARSLKVHRSTLQRVDSPGAPPSTVSIASDSSTSTDQKPGLYEEHRRRVI